jgi:hypothetical protein
MAARKRTSKSGTVEYRDGERWRDDLVGVFMVFAILGVCFESEFFVHAAWRIMRVRPISGCAAAARTTPDMPRKISAGMEVEVDVRGTVGGSVAASARVPQKFTVVVTPKRRGVWKT